MPTISSIFLEKNIAFCFQGFIININNKYTTTSTYFQMDVLELEEAWDYFHFLAHARCKEIINEFL